MAAKIVVILALATICKSNPVNLDGTYRDGRGIAISKASINNDGLGRYSGLYPDAKAEARAENSDSLQSTDSVANAVAEINNGLNYYRTINPIVAYEVPQVPNTYFLKNTPRKGVSWHFGTLYDTPNDVGSVHSGPGVVRYYDVYNGYGRLASANQASAKSSVDNSGVAKSSVDVIGAGQGSAEANNYGSPASFRYVEIPVSEHDIPNAADALPFYDTTVKAIADTNGFGSATSSATTNSFSSSSEAKANVNGFGRSSASSSVNPNTQGYYRFYDNRGFWRSLTPTATANAEVIGQGSAASYANTQNAYNLYRGAYLYPNAGHATAEARVHA